MGVILEHQIFRLAKMILPDRRNNLCVDVIPHSDALLTDVVPTCKRNAERLALHPRIAAGLHRFKEDSSGQMC
eukprot:s857_g29.t1